MGYLDYSYRISAAADFAASRGAPTNMANTGQALSSAGSMTLVDLGGGVRAWRFSGGAATGTTPTRTLAVTSGLPAGGGCTMVIRYALTTYPAANDDRIFWWHPSADSANGVGLRKFGAAGSYSCYRNGNTVYGPSNGEGSAMRTLVIKLVGNESSGTADEQVKTWINTVSRSGTAPNFVGTNNIAGTSGVFDTLKLLPTGVGVADVRDIVLYPSEKTDAECAALADDLDATLAIPTPVTFSGTVTAQTGTQGVAFSWAGSALSTYFANGTAPLAYSVQSGALPAGLAINSSTGVISGTPTVNGSFSIVVRATDSAGTPTTADTGTIGFTIAAAAATGTTLSVPPGGQVGVASAPITAGLNGTGTSTLTPSDSGAGGYFTPAGAQTITYPAVASWTYTPASIGDKPISVSNSTGLTAAAAQNYLAAATPGRFLLTANPADIVRAHGSNTPLASVGYDMWVHQAVSGQLVAKISGVTTVAGLFGTISNAALALSTLYRLDFKFSTGEFGTAWRTTEAS